MAHDTGSLVHYHAPNTRSAAISWLFEELGQPPHETKVLDMSKGEHKSQAYLAINPMGKVPAIVHRGTPITEVAAIAIYLADLFPAADLAPEIGDPARGTYLRWIVFNQAAVEPAATDRYLKHEPGSPGMMVMAATMPRSQRWPGRWPRGPIFWARSSPPPTWSWAPACAGC